MNLTKCSILFILYAIFLIAHQLNLDNLEIKSEKFYKKKENQKKVQDIFHSMLPHIVDFEYASDIIAGLVLLYIAINNFELIYTVAGFTFTIALIRQFIIQMTILPKNEVCDIKHSSVFRGGCYDKIFSAHFGITFLMTLLLYENGYINKLFTILINFVNGLFILLSRNHYTIDIIVSIFVVIIIYQNNLNICSYLDKYF
jgi:hypothetical protein